MVRIQENDFDLGAELFALRRNKPRIGALVSFVGLVRELNEGEGVAEMTLEHYPGMTEKALEAIVSEARRRWTLIDVLLIHRVGRLLPTDQIVLVAVAGTHRGEAFAACELIIDYLKTRAPFWKREVTPAGARWVDARPDDERAAARWRD
jgi:molybdopterin synthase catalytic subunit